MPYQGEVVYLYAFDVAYEMLRQPLSHLLGQPVERYVADVSKHSPQQLFFYRPDMIRLPAVERAGPRGLVSVRRTVKLMPVGAISISVRLPFSVERIEDLVSYYDLKFDGRTVYEEARDLAEKVRLELKAHYVRPVEKIREEEAYTAFCVGSQLLGPDGKPVSGREWLAAHRRQAAALLTRETALDRLSEQEVGETCARSLSYYNSDLCVVDWDAALLADDPKNFDEVIHIMELANVQLAELEAYDGLLDESLDRAYRDVFEPKGRPRRELLNELREIRIDTARLSDELLNITKFFGDWHLARIYQMLSARFHLEDWNRTIYQKLKTLDGLYGLLAQERDSRWMLILEATIVLLFITDLVMIFMMQG